MRVFLLPLLLLGGCLAADKEYRASLTNDGVSWDGGEAAPNFSSESELRRAVETVLLETWSRSSTFGRPIETADEEMCGDWPAGWKDHKAKLKVVEDKFKKTYTFHKRIGD